ncbi:MAG: PorT family protein [Cyclobacteriaceae bacterium]|nr:PorT family protein [Cyclobacteriaceae bacterium]
MNKQLLLSVFFWIASITFTFAQNLNVGVRGGLNYATVNNDIIYRYFNWYEYSQQPRIGFHVGVDALSQLSEKVALQAELFFSTEGAKASGQWTDSGEGKMKSIQKFSLLCLPVFVKFNLTPRFYIMGGPQVSYLVGSKYEYKDLVGNYITTEDNLETMNKIGWGMVPAIGYDLNKIGIGVRYYVGLNQLNKDDNTDRELKSRVFSIAIRYKLFHFNE